MMPPISLYIHIPWCVRKCPYCDFNSHQVTTSLPQKQYVDLLLQDLTHDLQHFNIDRPLQSIFIGGGTPSLFSADAMATLLNGVKELWPYQDIEITMEANPGTVEHGSFNEYKDAGINRISLGVQSFNPQQLKTLGRIHSADEAAHAIETIKAAGFDNFNCDLMFGLPEQSIAEGLQDLQTAIDFKPPHLSWYQLTLEPNTIFYKKPPKLPNEDLIADLHEQGLELLNQYGYHQYEVSAFSTPNRQCIHNLNYWQFGDYVGIGAGAHGKITLEDNTVIRTRKVKQPTSYLNNELLMAQTEIIEPHKIGFEYMLNRLRLNRPIPIADILAYTHLSLDAEDSPINTAAQKGFIRLKDDHVIKTELGERFLNDLLCLFL